MKRHLIIASLCLLLGAVVNMLVAWGCALWLESPLATRFERPATAWPHPAPPGWPPPVVVAGYTGPGWARWGYFAEREHSHCMCIFAFGFPMRSMMQEVWRAPWDKYPGVQHHWAWKLPRAVATEWRRLPLRPVAFAFAVNTAVYGGLAWAVAEAWPAARRTHRTRRGLCPACAYPVGSGEVCSECGEAVGPRGQESP